MLTKYYFTDDFIFFFSSSSFSKVYASRVAHWFCWFKYKKFLDFPSFSPPPPPPLSSDPKKKKKNSSQKNTTAARHFYRHHHHRAHVSPQKCRRRRPRKGRIIIIIINASMGANTTATPRIYGKTRKFWASSLGVRKDFILVPRGRERWFLRRIYIIVFLRSRSYLACVGLARPPSSFVDEMVFLCARV